METNFQRNLLFLASRTENKPAIDALTAYQDTASPYAVSEKNGALFVTRDRKPIVSAYDPGKEARRLVESELHDYPHITTLIALAAGALTHVILAVDTHPMIGTCILVEYDVSLLYHLFHAKTFPFLSRTFLVIAPEPEALASYIETHVPDYHADTTALLSHKRGQQPHAEHYRALHTAINRAIERKYLSLGTYLYFAPIWARNMFYTAYRTEGESARTLASALHGTTPLLLVAGGPSLDNVIEKVQMLASDAFVLALGTPARTLARAGVRPDAIITTDGGFYTTPHLTPFYGTDVPLITTYSAYPLPLRRFKRRIFFSHGSAIERVFAPQAPIFPMEGSVLITALRVAEYMTPSAIILAGADFANVGERPHSASAASSLRGHARATRLAPYTTRAQGGQKHVRLFSYNGSPLSSTITLSAYRDAFEQAVVASPYSYYTLSSESAKVSGVSLWNDNVVCIGDVKDVSFFTHAKDDERDCDALGKAIARARAHAEKGDAAALCNDTLAWEIAPLHLKRYVKNGDAAGNALCKEVRAFITRVGCFIR